MNLYQATFNTLVSLRLQTREEFIDWIREYDRELFYNMVMKKCGDQLDYCHTINIKQTIANIYAKFLYGYSRYNPNDAYNLEVAIDAYTIKLDMAVFFLLVDNRITDIDQLQDYWREIVYESGGSVHPFFNDIFERCDGVDIPIEDYDKWMDVGTESWSGMEMDGWGDVIVGSYSKRVRGFLEYDEKLGDELINWQNSLIKN